MIMQSKIACIFLILTATQTNAQLLTHFLAPLAGYMQQIPPFTIPTPTTLGSDTTTVAVTEPIRIDRNDIDDGSTKPAFVLDGSSDQQGINFNLLDRLFNIGKPTPVPTKVSESTTPREEPKSEGVENEVRAKKVGANSIQVDPAAQRRQFGNQGAPFRVDNGPFAQRPFSPDQAQGQISAQQQRQWQQPGQLQPNQLQPQPQPQPQHPGQLQPQPQTLPQQQQPQPQHPGQLQPGQQQLPLQQNFHLQRQQQFQQQQQGQIQQRPDQQGQLPQRQPLQQTQFLQQQGQQSPNFIPPTATGNQASQPQFQQKPQPRQPAQPQQQQQQQQPSSDPRQPQAPHPQDPRIAQNRPSQQPTGHPPMTGHQEIRRPLPDDQQPRVRIQPIPVSPAGQNFPVPKPDFIKQSSVIDVRALARDDGNDTTTDTPSSPASNHTATLQPEVEQKLTDKISGSAGGPRDYLKSARRLHYSDPARLQPADVQTSNPNAGQVSAQQHNQQLLQRFGVGDSQVIKQ